MSDLKNRTRIGNTVDNELLKKFKLLSQETKIPMSKLLDEAIQDLINKYNKGRK
ncbi:ribbon-helix-helix domain-containing protein [Heyndrickxia faecalis]|uniref:ribbon-helix-helix domain-containing protein n=1 Tax=Heyndrickxia faecalis TaxID=2824910 RepID=UPI0009BFEC39|nr:CopG family transcriptional regulator [Geobacillus sp. 44C]QNU33503.1 ribbon-helix-helix domain-containing protein [Geobacillus sp. 44C]